MQQNEINLNILKYVMKTIKNKLIICFAHHNKTMALEIVEECRMFCAHFQNITPRTGLLLT